MYRVEIDEQTDSIKLIVDPENGDRKVSQRRRRGSDKVDPIIDICRKDIAPPGTRIRADFYPNEIVVSLHHEEQKKAAP